MAKKEKKRIKTIILRTCVIGFVVLFVAVCIIGWHGSLQIKSWYIFTDSRVEKLEEIYEIDFPDDTEFSSYSMVWKFMDLFESRGFTNTLYIKDVPEPERFCRETFKAPTKIMVMADLKNAKVLENNSYSEEYAETVAKYSDKNEKWSIGERRVDFFCRVLCSKPKSEHQSLLYEIYFSQNDGGGYDVKIFMETLG